MTLVPFRLLETWLQARISIGVGGLLKQRLLAGALKLNQDEMRAQGIGHFLGQALEAETVETLTINGGIAGVLSTLELIVAAVILGRVGFLLTAWWLFTLILGWRFMKQFRCWTETRMTMTHDLVERMVGQRTRLAQQPREQWHEDEDRQMENYIAVSKTLDRRGSWLIAGAPRGWLLIGIACIAPGFVSGQSASADIAVVIGGTLLGFQAFRRLAGSLSDIAAAWVAWLQVGPLFRAAARPDALGHPMEQDDSNSAIEADSLVFRYRERGEPVLRGCSLRIEPGDRILVEGPSGGGKSTFASVLSGLRRPESGLLLCGGLDLATLGLDTWRRLIASAPQFHENHILTETLAFNLLMGRGWPPTPEDMLEAQLLCEQLGLGDLLARMPGGILQMVGEGGWQLSHGERSRVFMARALLQGGNLVILDESFAALDPESLGMSLGCAMERANTLMVIAHP
jgi:ATP-binding cassette subfamily B protein